MFPLQQTPYATETARLGLQSEVKVGLIAFGTNCDRLLPGNLCGDHPS